MMPIDTDADRLLIDHGVDLQERLFLVVYVEQEDADSDGMRNLYVLGGIPTHLLGHFEGALCAGNLMRTTCYTFPDHVLNRQGCQSAATWMYLPIAYPNASSQMGDSAQTTPDRVAYRAQLAALSSNTEDMEPLLDALHRDAYFDLATEAGRQRELAEYWALAYSCCFDPSLWRMREKWERALWSYRVRRIFCRERHWDLLLARNADLCSSLVHETTPVQDMDPRELVLYRERHGPATAYPRRWTRVVAESVGPEVAASPHYDVEDGLVYVTYRDAECWVAHQMKRQADRYLRRMRLAATRRRAPLEEMAWQSLSAMKRGLAQRRIQEASSASGQGAFPAIGSAKEVLLEHARRRMPPCQAQHVFRALVKGQHPLHHGRTSLVAFLAAAGHDAREIDQVMSSLYEADTEFVKRRVSGKRWSDAAYRAEYGGQARSIVQKVRSDQMGPYGCASLIQAAGSQHGCPLARPAAQETRALMKWMLAGDGPPDIEDVLGPAAFANERCMRCHARQFSDVDRTPVIKHPMQYIKHLK